MLYSGSKVQTQSKRIRFSNLTLTGEEGLFPLISCNHIYNVLQPKKNPTSDDSKNYYSVHCCNEGCFKCPQCSKVFCGFHIFRKPILPKKIEHKDGDSTYELWCHDCCFLRIKAEIHETKHPKIREFN
jgi:hypothetical protein